MDEAAARKALVGRRSDLLAELGELTAVPTDPMGSVSFGKRIGEGTTAAIDRIEKVGTASELQAMLKDVDAALARMDEGTYGICERCGATIPDERLEARPWTTLCVSCAALR
jgi:DnaK suppressor protein